MDLFIHSFIKVGVGSPHGEVAYVLECEIVVSGWLVGWFYGISTFVGYLMSTPFLYK